MQPALFLLLALLPAMLTTVQRFEAGFGEATTADSANIGYNMEVWAPAGHAGQKKREPLEDEIETLEFRLSDLYNLEGRRCLGLCKKKPKEQKKKRRCDLDIQSTSLATLPFRFVKNRIFRLHDEAIRVLHKLISSQGKF